MARSLRVWQGLGSAGEGALGGLLGRGLASRTAQELCEAHGQEGACDRACGVDPEPVEVSADQIGPNDLAGFIDAPLTGPPHRPAMTMYAAIPKADKAPTFCAPEATARTVLTSPAVSRTSTMNA